MHGLGAGPYDHPITSFVSLSSLISLVPSLHTSPRPLPGLYSTPSSRNDVLHNRRKPLPDAHAREAPSEGHGAVDALGWNQVRDASSKRRHGLLTRPSFQTPPEDGPLRPDEGHSGNPKQGDVGSGESLPTTFPVVYQDIERTFYIKDEKDAAEGPGWRRRSHLRKRGFARGPSCFRATRIVAGWC